MAWNLSARQWQEQLHPREVYQITGTGRSFASNTSEFDDKAMEELHKIILMGRDAVDVHDDFLDREPENIPGNRLFLCQNKNPFNFYSWGKMLPTGAGKWKTYASAFGYGVGNSRLGYLGLKWSYVYHMGGRKTNWIMNIYSPITQNIIKADDIFLCHVFQSDGSYDPCPKPVHDDYYNQIAMKSNMDRLESLLQDPNAFKDFDECHENSGAHSAGIRNGKRSRVWENFTEIKVLGPNVKIPFFFCQTLNATIVPYIAADDCKLKSTRDHRILKK